MPFNIDNPIPLSFNAMSDDQLKEFLANPNEFIVPLKDTYIAPSPISPQTRERIDEILKVQGLSDKEIKDKIDVLALIKITKIVVEW